VTVAAHEDTRARIRQVALELFAARGFEKTSLREIADRLGVTKAALYYHFPSKDALLESQVAPLLDEVDALLDDGEALRAGVARQREFLERYLDLLLGHRALIGWLVNDVAVLAHPAVGLRARAQAQRIQALLGGDAVELAERVRVTAALGALNSGVANFPDTPSDDLRAPLLAAARAVLGLRAGARRPGG
jgi:AcrR family transcriptional regulator